jgi:ankyrin repeat protein
VPKHTSRRSEGSHAKLVQLLLEHGADVSARDGEGATALHNASLMRDLEVARMLLNHGADVNATDKWGWTALHRVLEAEDHSDEIHFSVAQLLVDHGADVNARTQDRDRRTPLHLASCSAHLKSVRMLLDHGASIEAKDNYGWTPLHQVLMTFERYSESDESDDEDIVNFKDHFGCTAIIRTWRGCECSR